MSVTVLARALGKSFDASGARIGYIAFCDGGETEEDVIAAVIAEAPTSYVNFPRGQPTAREISMDGSGEPAVWEIEVPYGRATGRLAPLPTNTVVWSGTTEGGTQKITSPIEVVFAYTDPDVTELPDDWGQSIGATKDGGVDGTEIIVPVVSFVATKFVAAGDFSDLLHAANLLTGKVNDDVWTADTETYAEGEVLFKGVKWQKRVEVSPNDYECTFEFEASPNVEDVTIGGITGIAKSGWDFLDITYEQREQNGFSFQKPVVATVFKVYERGDFSALGL